MNFEEARFNMIEQQIRPCSVLDMTVLETMSNLPRDEFVSDEYKALAYADIATPLIDGQTMMHPRIEGLMLQDLAIGVEDNCLEIGTGSGYIAACMALMSQHVHTIEINPTLAEQAQKNIAAQNISNISFQTGDGLTDLNDKKYDVIAVTAAIPDYITLFEEKLNIGGRLFVVTGSQPNMHAMKVVKIDENNVSRVNLFETELASMIGVKKASSFTF